MLNLKSNNLSGVMPTLAGLNNLAYVDIQDNELTDASQVGFPSQLSTCNMMDNMFICPVAWKLFQNCNAR